METQINMDTVCAPSEDVVAREIEGEIIIVPLVAGIGDAEDELYTLNETGQAIWQQLDGEKSLGQIIQVLQQEYSVSSEELESDVLGFAQELTRRGILTSKQQPPPDKNGNDEE